MFFVGILLDVSTVYNSHPTALRPVHISRK